MSFDQFVDLAQEQVCPQGYAGTASGLATGFVDGCTVWSCRPKPSNPPKKKPAPADEARRCYMERASSAAGLELPADLRLDATFESLVDPCWIGLDVAFELETPWYSKDDRPFHVLDNPVRKDRVFGVPLMAAASWKGLLRWSCRLTAGLQGHIEKNSGKLDGWKDPDWLLHLFGNEKSEQERFHRGALAFYPTWFSQVGFEVINPHSRERRAGTQPIYYEVVPVGAEGTLRLLYAPLPGDEGAPADALASLVDAVEALLTTYGFSAKRTAGWGTASVQRWTAQRTGHKAITADSASHFKAKLQAWVTPAEAGDE